MAATPGRSDKVDIDGHYYLEGHRLIREQSTCASPSAQSSCSAGANVAVHLQQQRPPTRQLANIRAESTHRHYADWTIERIRADAAAIGPSTAKLTALILEPGRTPSRATGGTGDSAPGAPLPSCAARWRPTDRGLDIGARSTAQSNRSSSTVSTGVWPPWPAQGELLPDHPNICGPRYYH